MYVVDGHCDTLFAMYSNKNELQLSYEKICSLGISYLQFFAICCPPSILNEKNGFNRSLKVFQGMNDIYNCSVAYEKFHPVKTRNDVIDFINHAGSKKNAASPVLYSLLSVEGIYLSKGELAYIDELYDKGVRCMSLTWNPSNELGQGVKGDEKLGLSVLGRNTVRKCNELGILLDVSHANDHTFWDLAGIASKPFTATHSNARALCSNKRNLSDEMIKTIAEKNGVIGINYFNDFLIEKANGINATVSDILKHVEYICALVGTDHIGLGSDLDGMDNTPIKDICDVTILIDALYRANYKEDDIRKICGGNFLRVLLEVMK
ncbi:MAG: membrane dipeptidase [Clostridia bacterium]|jgi:membrane dipeptidase